MLSKEDNELLTNTNAGSPMGELMRRFWLPVALSQELPGPDCVPVKLKILNEDLIAYRDTNGDVGLVDAYCPHRGAPIFFARNEEAGIRCVYHGWKFDTTGACVDMPNTPEGETFKNKVQIVAYPCQEAGGIVFSYMGPKEKQPPFPEFDFLKVPASHTYVTKFQLECNYMQATEGDFDPSHVGFLHSTLDDNRGNPGQQFAGRVNPLTGIPNQNLLANGTMAEDEPFPFVIGKRRVTSDHQLTKDKVQITDVDGAMFQIRRNSLPDGREFALASLSFVMPLYCPPGTSRPNHFSQNIRTPIDNTHMMFFRLRWSLTPMTPDDLVYYKQGGYAYPEMIPGTFKTRANVWNDYEVDRLGQRNFLFSGIKTFPLQDISMMENQWGPLAKRELEHLTSMDYPMIYLRRKLLKAARAMKEGIEPQEPWLPQAYHYHAAAAPIVNGNYAGAVEEALGKAKESIVPAELAALAAAAV